MYNLNIPLIGLPRLGFLPEEHRLGGSKVPAMLLLMVMATAATWLAAQVTWHLLEKHCLKLKRHFTIGEHRAPSPVPVAAD